MPDCNYNHAQLHPSERVQKRVVLHQSFRSIKDRLNSNQKILYLTFGGSGLWDVLDLVIALNPMDTEIRVNSFELDSRITKEALNSKVYKQLNKLPSVKIEVHNGRFPDDFLNFDRDRIGFDRCVLYLDWKDVFKMRHAEDVCELLGREVLTQDDFIVVTSSMTERVINQPNFVSNHVNLFERYYGESSHDFRKDHFVETLITSKLRSKDLWIGTDHPVQPKSVELVSKFLYKDTSRMGLWLFNIIQTKKPGELVKTTNFTGFKDISHQDTLRKPRPKLKINK